MYRIAILTGYRTSPDSWWPDLAGYQTPKTKNQWDFISTLFWSSKTVSWCEWTLLNYNFVVYLLFTYNNCDGVTLVPWSNGRCLTWDVMVPDTLVMSHLDRTSISSEAAAELAAVNKTMKYSDMLLDYHFVPVVVKTLGPWCDAAMNLIIQLCQRMTVVTRE